MEEPSEQGSVTQWLDQLAAQSDSFAQHQLFHRYFRQLVALARDQLRHPSQLSRDAEDVALSAMDSFFQRFEHGDFAELNQRSDLWALLVTIAARKAINQTQLQHSTKRGGGNVYCQSDMTGANAAQYSSVLERIASKEPSPDMIVQLAEECRHRLNSLPDRQLQAIATLKLQGNTNAEIAMNLGVALRTVGRKLYRIRREWLKDWES